MCLAVASRISGTLVHRLARSPAAIDDPVRVAQPSGLTVVGAQVAYDEAGWRAQCATVYRTARRLMEGTVFVRGSLFEGRA
jgi:2-methylaconitate cis-trans-isomerase PrpF